MESEGLGRPYGDIENVIVPSEVREAVAAGTSFVLRVTTDLKMPNPEQSSAPQET